ncbi:unnamed protein product [Durusdinium trenchii]|uniref:Integrase catalytic domain-containing protein n=1 Tax=Durusdinium trenchii TaxID=1381693 RepID=A0ABP0MXC2_9DINO
MSSGPPMSYVKWRRTIDANANELIFEGVIDPDEEEENKLHFGEPRNIITEFWFTPPPEANHYYYGYDETIREIEPGWDGSDENYLPPTKRYYQVYVEQLASSVDDLLSRLSDSDTDVDDYKTGKRLTRQEKKQIEKELSFHDILSQSEEYIQKFIESAQKEETSFLEWKSLKPVPPEETKRILSDPEQKKRVISSRACYRDKNKNVPPLKAKTRIVARGNQDPDLKSLTRQAPTPTRVSEMMTFLIFLSGLHSKAFRSDKVWKLWAGDASTAFLQGQQDLSERAGKLYLKAPRDPLLIRAGVFKSELYEILGNVYGLSNATWAQEVTKRLVNLGFIVHSFDRMMFWYPDPDNAPCPAAVLICYVDDFLITFNTSFPFQQFVDSFKWGSQQFLEQGSPLVFKGKEIHLEQTGDVQTLRIVQETFITNLEMGQVGKKQNKAEVLASHVWPEFRSISGCLQWLSGQTRLDISSAVSLSNRGQETTYADLDCLYKTLQHVKDTSKLGIRLYPGPIDESTVVMAYSDASWANAQGSASQRGQIITLAPATVTEKPCYGGLMYWKSSRSKRVCRSTLAAEAVSADSAADRLAYVQYALGELVFGVAAHRVGPRLRALLATDCKSLYDSVSSPNPTVEDKRSLVNIRSIQEVVSRNTIHWIPTALQMADSLTKVSADLRDTLLSWLQKPVIHLRECGSGKASKSSVGIEYIEQTLKSGLATRLVYQKRKLMSDYESIVRQPSESVRAFANRYRRAEQALQSVSVDIRGMYDDESRGNRLLERSRLSPENQRLVLIGSAYNLAYEVEDDQLEAIEEEDDPHESEAEHEAEQEDDQYDQQELADEEAPEESFADIAEVLTVTAKKLQSLTLGRKFSGSKSIEERKKTSTCAACGQVGFSVRQWSTYAGPRKHPPFSQSQMLRPTPPRWLKAWRQVIQTLLSLEWLSLQWMSKMVKLQAGRFTRAWMTLHETVAQQEVDKTLARMKREPPSSSLGAYAVQASQAAQVVIYSDEEEYMDDSQVNSQDEEWNWEEHQQPIQTQGPIRPGQQKELLGRIRKAAEAECTMYEDNTNYKDRPEELAERRALERPVVEEAMQWCRMQRQAGRYYLIENPQTSRLWDEESVQSMLQDTGGQTVTCHSGAYGAMNSKGNPIRKTFRFASNNKDILTFLQDKLSAEELKLRVPLEGKETTLSQEYPQRLITSILKGVRYVARLQVCLRPLVQRLPQHVPHTHRGHVLKFVGREDLSIMAEDLADIHFPRGRFEAPVELAIFFYGYPSLSDEHLGIPGEEAALHDQEPQQAEHRQNPTKEIFHDEIFFPNTPGIDRTIKASVARMHKNMGHLPPNETIKLFCLNGITSDQVIKCTKAMTCSACEQAKPPKPPNPASSHPQYLGQFADNLQADIFYLRDATSRNHPVLGIICEATHLHAAIRLDSRQPIHLAQAFRNAWVRNFGFPLRLSVDDDGAFKSNFMDYCDEGGVFLDFIPPEAHFKLGTIERHNGTLRMLLEKIVDSTPCSTPEDLDNAIVSALYSKNSATWTSGRPPFIAAFGKIPRVGLDFINDPRALIAGSSRSEAQQQAAMMRCEAYKALAEASSTLRRALLRKTNQQPAEPPEPGSLLAYWRWTVRSHRKRGGYRIARYLGKDPDNSSYWIQSGSHTIKVAPNQVRNVFGYEEYVPTREDVKALKAAEDNIRSDLWQDHRLPPEAEPPLPDEEPEIPPEDAAAFELADGDFPSVDAPLTTPEVHEPPPHEPLVLPLPKKSPALAIQDQRESFDPSQPSAPHPGDGESAPNNAAGWLTPHGLDPSPPQALPDQPVDLTGDDDDGQPDLSRIVPTTPQGIADEPLPQLPAKRPFDALKADVSARMNAPGSFELYGYQSDFARPFQNLECWARLDLCVSQPPLRILD